MRTMKGYTISHQPVRCTKLIENYELWNHNKAVSSDAGIGDASVFLMHNTDNRLVALRKDTLSEQTDVGR